MMKFVGITGGVGAGKSAILDYLRQKDKARVMLADEIAHDLMEPGQDCYRQIRDAFPQAELVNEDGTFHRNQLATFIFSDEKRREELNRIVHPAVKAYVVDQYEKEKQKGELTLLVLEAALLIEEQYDEICDELWYIYTDETNRRARLKASRGYSDEKIDNIFASQLSEEIYRENCKEVIDNNGDLEGTCEQIEKALGRLLG